MFSYVNKKTNMVKTGELERNIKSEGDVVISILVSIFYL